MHLALVEEEGMHPSPSVVVLIQGRYTCPTLTLLPLTPPFLRMHLTRCLRMHLPPCLLLVLKARLVGTAWGVGDMARIILHTLRILNRGRGCHEPLHSVTVTPNRCSQSPNQASIPLTWLLHGMQQWKQMQPLLLRAVGPSRRFPLMLPPSMP